MGKKDFADDKKLCKLVKDDALDDHLSAYIDLVDKPRFVCSKCGRVAREKKNLCKPEKMDK